MKLYSGNGSEACAVVERVFREPLGRGEGVGDFGNGALARMNGGVHCHRDKVVEPIYGVAQGVETLAEVADGVRREGLGGGQYGFRFNEGHGLGFGERKVADEKGFTRCGVRVKGDINGFEWRLAADCHQI